MSVQVTGGSPIISGNWAGMSPVAKSTRNWPYLQRWTTPMHAGGSPPPHCRSSDLHRVDRTPSTRRPTAPVASASILAPNRWHSRPLQPAAPFTRRVLGQIGGASQGHGIRLVGSDTHLSTSAPPPRSAAHRGWLRHPESVRRLLRTRCVRCQIKDLSPSAARLHNRDDGPVRLEPHLHLPSGVVVEVSID